MHQKEHEKNGSWQFSTLGESKALRLFMFSLGGITAQTVSSNGFNVFRLQVERENAAGFLDPET